MRTSVVIDDELAAEAKELGINMSEAARDGLRTAVRRRRAEHERDASRRQPETRRVGGLEPRVVDVICLAIAIAVGCDDT